MAVSRRIRRLTSSDLTRQQVRCPACPLDDGADLAWVTAAQRQWGFIGVALYTADQLTAYALVAPSLHVPRSHPGHGRCYADPGAAVLLALHDDPDQPRAARTLIEALAGRLRVASGRLRTVEALATTGTPTCVTPELTRLEAAGFRVVDADPRLPVCRLDLRSAILHDAANGVRDRLRRLVPLPPPQTNSRTARRLRAEGG